MGFRLDKDVLCLFSLFRQQRGPWCECDSAGWFSPLNGSMKRMRCWLWLAVGCQSWDPLYGNEWKQCLLALVLWTHDRWYKMFDRWKLGLYPWILMIVIWCKLKVQVLVQDAHTSHTTCPSPYCCHLMLYYSFCNPANRFKYAQVSEKVIHQEICRICPNLEALLEFSVKHMFQVPDVWLKALLGAYAGLSALQVDLYIVDPVFTLIFSAWGATPKHHCGLYWNWHLI